MTSWDETVLAQYNLMYLFKKIYLAQSGSAPADRWCNQRRWETIE